MEMQNGQIKQIKLVVVGDGAVGKTCMLMSYTTNTFPTDYVPTVFDNFAASVKVNEEVISLSLWDTAGQEDFDRLRPLSYPGTDVFLACYAVDNRSSFANLKSRWFPEIRLHAPNAKVLLVGTKTDVRDVSRGVDVSPAKAYALKDEMKAQSYHECSALTQKGLKAVFDEAIKAVLDIGNPKKSKKKKACTIL